MKRGLPLAPTLFVAIAVPVMLALGYWQWFVRAPWKEALLAQLAANASAPVVALPAQLTERDAFRLVRADCTRLKAQGIGGAAEGTGGAVGFRHLALCQPPAGEPVLVSLGVARDPKLTVATPASGAFTGRLVPRSGSPAYLLVSEHPVPPLAAETPPGIDTISNSHRSYGIQWWAFAVTLSIIYVIYVRRWQKLAAVAVLPPER